MSGAAKATHRLRVRIEGSRIWDAIIIITDEHGNDPDYSGELIEAADDLARMLSNDPEKLMQVKAAGDDGLLLEVAS